MSFPLLSGGFFLFSFTYYSLVRSFQDIQISTNPRSHVSLIPPHARDRSQPPTLRYSGAEASPICRWCNSIAGTFHRPQPPPPFSTPCSSPPRNSSKFTMWIRGARPRWVRWMFETSALGERARINGGLRWPAAADGVAMHSNLSIAWDGSRVVHQGL